MLSYPQELIRSGRVLFSVRGLFMYALILVGTLLVWQHRPQGPFVDPAWNRLWSGAGLAVALAGLGLRILVQGYAALGTSGRVLKAAEAAELNTTGPYSLVRNPLYVGRILNFTGIAMLTGLWGYAAVVFLLGILVYERISLYEEAFLVEKFGDAHRQWAAEVPALLPRLHGWVRPKYPFWWRRMIWRESNKLFQLAGAIVLFHFARHGFSADPAVVGAVWLKAAVAVPALWAVLLLFRHGTRYFSDLS